MSFDGELAARWAVRVAVLGYFVGGAMRLAPRSASQERAARMVWTMGCLFYLAHVVCAFQFFHHWSHAAAYQRTAEQTAAVTGWNWGGGLYFNYFFTAVWLADVVALWLPSRKTECIPLEFSKRNEFRSTTRRGWIGCAIQVFLWFMVFNATVVFGQGIVRWCGAIGCGCLLVLAVQRFAHRGEWR